MIAELLRRIVPASIKRPLKAALGWPQTRLNSDWRILQPMGPI
jgi:hypothetical protein